MKHLHYLKYLIRHKWYVFVAGCWIMESMWWPVAVLFFFRLLIHDWSKFLPQEWFPYVEEFYGKWRTRAQVNLSDADIHRRFEVAWLHHQHFNKHHWQHWVLREDDGGIKFIPMPEIYLCEMVADWFGAGRTITGKWESDRWYADNKQKILLNAETRTRVETMLQRTAMELRGTREPAVHQ